jgi:hypothetical protein
VPRAAATSRCTAARRFAWRADPDRQRAGGGAPGARYVQSAPAMNLEDLNENQWKTLDDALDLLGKLSQSDDPDQADYAREAHYELNNLMTETD